jgi:hypothetical protein
VRRIGAAIVPILVAPKAGPGGIGFWIDGIDPAISASSCIAWMVLQRARYGGVLVWQCKSLMVCLEGDAFVSVRSRRRQRGRGTRVR